MTEQIKYPGRDNMNKDTGTTTSSGFNVKFRGEAIGWEATTDTDNANNKYERIKMSKSASLYIILVLNLSNFVAVSYGVVYCLSTHFSSSIEELFNAAVFAIAISFTYHVNSVTVKLYDTFPTIDSQLKRIVPQIEPLSWKLVLYAGALIVMCLYVTIFSII